MAGVIIDDGITFGYNNATARTVGNVMQLVSNTKDLIVNYKVAIYARHEQCLDIDAVTMEGNNTYLAVAFQDFNYFGHWVADFEVMFVTDGNYSGAYYFGGNQNGANYGNIQVGAWNSYYEAYITTCVTYTNYVTTIPSGFNSVCIYNACGYYYDQCSTDYPGYYDPYHYDVDFAQFWGQVRLSDYSTTTPIGTYNAFEVDPSNPNAYITVSGVNTTDLVHPPCLVCEYTVINNACTLSPTTEPTNAPTTEPTVEPTVAPTVAPSGEPTVEPSPSPSGEPTVEPSPAPSPKPTCPYCLPKPTPPTKSPVFVPTHYPTSSKKPSIAPTHYPTSECKPPTPTRAPTYCVCQCDEGSAPTHYPTTHLDKASPTHWPTHTKPHA